MQIVWKLAALAVIAVVGGVILFIRGPEPVATLDNPAVEDAAAPVVHEVRYDRDVRPILSDRCFKCHGPDDRARKASLRLDLEESAFGDLPSGRRAIVPGVMNAAGGGNPSFTIQFRVRIN